MNLDQLNSKQKEAVLHGEGPLLVLAGAGSGKTSTMAYRIAHLVAARKISPRQILGLSFTNKAAGELKERVVKLIVKTTGSRPKELTISTFHALCVRMLRQHAEALGFQSDFSIVDRNDQKDILKDVFKNVRLDDRRFDLDVLLFEFGQAKGRFLSPSVAETFFLESGRLGSDYGIAAATAFPKYQQQLRALNSMDFDDLLYYGVRLLEEHPKIREGYNERFRHILVDEYQDTNPAQFRLLKLLTEYRQNICVVGDDDQSIYAWRGADPAHILGFGKCYPGASTVILDQNYRSTNTILKAANAVIKNNKDRHDKRLWSDRGEGEPLVEVLCEEDREEGKFVAEELFRIAQERKRPWKDFAILYRSNAQSRIFEEALRMLRVPYKIVGGYSFLDRKEVKNVLAYWKLIQNPRDDAALRRILNWPARGIGKTSAEALGTHAFEKGISLFEALEHAESIAPRSGKGAAELRAAVLALREDLQSVPAHGVVGWGKRALERFKVKEAVEQDCEDPVQFVRSWENVEELLHALGQIRPEELVTDEAPAPDAEGIPAAAAEGPGLRVLRDFLSRMMLEAQNAEEDKKDKDKDATADQVTLLTLHGAKGLEFPIVFMVGMEDGSLPHQRTIDGGEDLGEERRLCYVGITRAKDQLIMTRARNRIRYGKAVPRVRSRFMEELPKDLLISRDESHGPPALSTVEERKAHEEKVKDYLADIKARLLSKSK